MAQALGMKILVSTRTKREDEKGIHFVDRETLLRNSDFISLHCPLNDNTRYMINEKALEIMKESAFIINTARGALIDEKALIHALKEKKIAGAGLDVVEEEPLQKDNPLCELENVILTPHMGWRGVETRQRLVQMVKEDIRAYKEGKMIHRIV